MTDPSPTDRRRHPRAPLTLLVQYRFDSGAEFTAEYATDLSPGGIFLRCSEPAEVGTTLHLQFSLKDGSRLVEGLARVARVVRGGTAFPAGMGLEFVQFDPESIAVVRQLCEGRLPGAR